MVFLIQNNYKFFCMITCNKIVYVPPVYESIQHDVTSVDKNNNPLRTSFHTDVSLLLRIDSLRADAQTIREIRESLQPMIDTSNFRAQFEDTFGSLTDEDLINSCPSRYTQTASEKMSYLRELAAKDREVRDKAISAAKEKEEKEKLEKENNEFQSRLLEIFK